MILKNACSVAADSGIEDTASYLEPTAISLRESEFQQTDDVDGSTMEGSVVDMVEAERLNDNCE